MKSSRAHIRVSWLVITIRVVIFIEPYCHIVVFALTLMLKLPLPCLERATEEVLIGHPDFSISRLRYRHDLFYDYRGIYFS
jgi:hypothetical protein